MSVSGAASLNKSLVKDDLTSTPEIVVGEELTLGVGLAVEQPLNEELPLSGELEIGAGQFSAQGAKSTYEDAIGIRIPDGLMLTTKGAVSVICDGVSAAEEAEKASGISISNFIADYYSTPDTWSVEKSSSQVLTALNRWLYGLGQDYREAQRGYVCTFTALIFKSCSAHLLHVGDSRAYRFSAGKLERLSRDHVTVLGRDKRYLARALGLDVKLDVDYRKIELKRGDLYLLTTDGVHDVISDQDLTVKLSEFMSTSSYKPESKADSKPELNPSFKQESDVSIDHDEFCRLLCAQAIDAGSLDNVSCQLLSIDTLPKLNIDDLYQRLSKLPFPPPLSEGMRLDGYLIEEILHQSQRSQVYLASDADGNKRCIKTPSVNYLDDAAYIERFMLESWIGHRINSPNVVRLLDRDRAKSALYYVTEHLNGLSLSTWITRNPKASVQEVLPLLKQIESGVRAFHRKETIHQDLKPDNILLTYEGQIKLIDFGSCHIKGIAEIATPLQRDSILGTADYSAPESVLGYRVTNKADLFSMAVITFEMLTGQLPFKGKLAQCRTKLDYLKLAYIPSYELNPLIPLWMDPPLKKALSFDPASRQVDTSELLYELNQPLANWDKPEVGRSLLERDPVRFWQGVSVLFGLSTLLLLLS
ncbi:serine/threonine protein kinase [Shewanella psychrophila]|uniref:Serine/threonine protein kinase n=1 Tax=Shewanella psychrophila TaxID=225848 RepID=A0A1S6HMM2_9GAMM|nr:bifunctional protein-serine/threonine kinase/phosphatase [Shewanella psychrophila]AQS36754.1 serine/threonine protein kinase [Shewanella psychrophila]